MSPWPAAGMFGSLFGLLVLLAVAIWQNIKARHDQKTDHMIRKGMAEAYKRGWIARENHDNH